MTLEELNNKIQTLPWTQHEQVEYQRDERLGILGCHAGMKPTEEQIAIVHQELFPGELPCSFPPAR